MKLTDLSDAELVTCFRETVIQEQERLALQLRMIAELDRRKLFFHYSSLRSYLVEEHGMEEWEAERRIRAARMIGRFPFVLRKIETGKLNPTLLEIAQGCAHREGLSDSEVTELLEAISGMSVRAAKREIASRYPLTMVFPTDRVRPLTAELSEVRLIMTEVCLEKLEELKGLLAQSHPRMSLGELIDHLATDYRTRHHPEEKAKRTHERAKERAEKKQEKKSEGVETPTAPLLEPVTRESGESKPEKRYFSRAQVHALTLRDGYRCGYVDPVTKKRCESTFALQIDHVRSWAQGGKTELENARYACRQHHRRISYLEFGEASKYIGK